MLLVYGIYLLETTQTALVMQTVFHMLVTSFGDFHSADKVEMGWLGIPVMTAIGTFFAQGFYAHRLSKLSKSKIVPISILLLSFVQLVSGIITGVYVKEARFLTHVFTTKIHLVTGIWNGGSALCDTIIAVSMTYYLSRLESSVKQTQRLLRRIIHLTVETGIITAILAIASFVLTLLPGNPAYYQVVMGTVGKVYANSMLVLINSRISLRVEAEKSVVASFSPALTFQRVDLELSEVSNIPTRIQVTKEYLSKSDPE